MDYAAGERTVTQAVTVHVGNRCFSFVGKDLFLPGFHAKSRKARSNGQVIPPRRSQQISDDLKVSNRRPVYTDVDL
jgi:hypothetical protein